MCEKLYPCENLCVYSNHLAVYNFFPSSIEKIIKLLPKPLKIEKEIVCEVARGDIQYRKQSADRKAQVSSMSKMNAFLICALQSADCFSFI